MAAADKINAQVVAGVNRLTDRVDETRSYVRHRVSDLSKAIAAIDAKAAPDPAIAAELQALRREIHALKQAAAVPKAPAADPVAASASVPSPPRPRHPKPKRARPLRATR